MKTSVVIADEHFLGNTAPLTGRYETTLLQAAEIGFDAVQLSINRPQEIDAKLILQTASRCHLAVSSIATGMAYSVDGLSLGSPDEENRAAATLRMKQQVELAVRLGGARVIIGAIRGHASSCSCWQQYESQFRRSIEQLLPYAEQQNIDILFEANDHLETDAYLTVTDTANFIKDYASPYFLLQLDTMHLLYEKQDPYQEVINHANLIAQIDISDEGRMAPDGKHFDFSLLMKALKEIDYQDYLVFEYRPAPPQNAAKAGLTYIRQLM